jgi:hypothetical protein
MSPDDGDCLAVNSQTVPPVKSMPRFRPLNANPMRPIRRMTPERTAQRH